MRYWWACPVRSAGLTSRLTPAVHPGTDRPRCRLTRLRGLGMVAPLRASGRVPGNSVMPAVRPILLGLGLLLSGAEPARAPRPDLAHLQEMLHLRAVCEENDAGFAPGNPLDSVPERRGVFRKRPAVDRNSDSSNVRLERLHN